MTAVWVIRDAEGALCRAFVEEPSSYIISKGATLTRETLLTPEQAAVIAAAKAYVDFMYGFREELDAVPFVDGLLTAVDAAREVQT